MCFHLHFYSVVYPLAGLKCALQFYLAEIIYLAPDVSARWFDV